MARTPLPSSAMDELWMRMASRYGHAWVSQYGPLPDGIAAAEWRSTLWGLTPEQLREGFEADAVRGSEWPPSSPKFRSMCFGVPSIASVRLEISDMCRYAGMGQESIVSRFTRGVWSRINSYAYRNATGKVAERMVADAYELTKEFVLEGGTLPVDPVARLPTRERIIDAVYPKTVDPEIAKENIRRMAEILGEKIDEA